MNRHDMMSMIVPSKRRARFGRRSLACFCGLLIWAMPSGAVRAGITVTVVPSSAPNAFGSPSWSGYMSNALSSLENGTGNIGNRSTDPTAYEVAGPTVPGGDAIVTSFNSWRGVADPSAPFANEKGNRLHFGLHITGDGSVQFRLNELAFDMTSSDGVLDFSGDFNGYDYNGARFGVDWGADRVKGGGDDTIFTSGNGMTLVDELVYVGVGNAYWALGSGTNQEEIDNVLAYINSVGAVSLSTTYTMFDPSGANVLGIGQNGVTIIPAPGAALLAILGLGLVRSVRRRRHGTPVTD